jgi:hypothetical protein
MYILKSFVPVSASLHKTHLALVGSRNMSSELDRWDCSASGPCIRTCHSSISPKLPERNKGIRQEHKNNSVRRTCIIPTTLGGPSGMVTLGFQLLTKYPALEAYCSKSTRERLSRDNTHLFSVSVIAEHFRYLRDRKVIIRILHRGN